MFRKQASLLTLAVLFPCVLSGGLLAETASFRNDCRAPLVVQTATVVRGVLKRDQCLLRPGESTPKMTLDTDKVVTVYDGKTGRLLFRGALRVSTTPLNYSIVPDLRLPNRVSMVLRNPAAMAADPRAMLPAGPPPSSPPPTSNPNPNPPNSKPKPKP